MWRLTERMVRSTLVTAWRLAISPTSTSPFLLNPPTAGVVRPPPAFAMMVGSPPSRTPTAAHTAAPDAGCQNQTPQSCVHLTQLHACGECSPNDGKLPPSRPGTTIA